MKAKAHLQTINHFSFTVLDAQLFRDSWEAAFGVRIPEIMPPSDGKFSFTHAPTYRGGPWPAGKSYGVPQVSVPPLYQPGNRMIEVKAAGTLPSGIDFYEKNGNGIQYFGIVEGENRNPFLKELKETWGCEVMEEMFYDPLPGDFCIAETEPVLGFNLCVKENGALNGLVQVILPETAECTVAVPDAGKAAAVWSDIFDIRRPEVVTVREKCRIRGREEEAEFRMARIDEGPFTIHLAENVRNSPFAGFAEKHGAGIHHITFPSEDGGRAFTARMKDALGIGVLAEYDLEGKHYTLFDSTEKMGGIIAVR